MIFEGPAKLHLWNAFEDILSALFHWLECLTDIRRAASGGEWYVHRDDTGA
ncbi:hypothetical protein LI951_03130 [Enterococcus sp. BWT-B8]|uniref:hypothetical protein n=1 Tax=unclassified Enterococcus TaxID=2608891 RepID=UPI001E297EBF|nr:MULTISPECIES: hypothetical protein [unclassified Enterococcus]MCB5951052.1 hypothetical protein [Enterococcus sp. BWT-B8]MCB5955118.1 hypothetical protein [Enterococcus sp. CWB-B31]